MVIFALLLFLGITAQQAACDRHIIVPSPSSPCPGERNGVFCQTLQQFVSASRVGQSLMLELKPGIHVLETQFIITGTNSIEIIGHNATILCSTSYYYFSNYLNFRSIEHVNISGITFVDCRRIYLYNVYSATISGSRFDTLRLSSSQGLELQTLNISIHSCTFVGQSTGLKLYLTNSSINSCDFLGNRRGMHLQYSTVTIFNCTFRDNRIISDYGSAIYMYRSNSVSVTQSIFINNSASYSYGGGAIYMSVYILDRMESSLTIDGCIFANNRAYQGGALYMNMNRQIYISRPSSCTIYRSVFINNKAISSGGAISTHGNISIVDSIFGYNVAPQCATFGVRTRFSTQHLQLRVNFQSSVFLYNWAINATNEDTQPAIIGGVACIRDASLTINNCTFSHNLAKESGGVLNAENSSVTISSSSFHNNSAGTDGGVLYTYLFSSTFVLTECSFTNNGAGDDGGAIYIGNTRSSLDIRRSSFSHNVANDRGGAVIVFGTTITQLRETNMHNNEANFGDDIGVCTGSNFNSFLAILYLNNFQVQTSSTECNFYGGLTTNFTISTPEDHSDTNLSQYLEISKNRNPYPYNNPTTTTSEGSTTAVTNTDSEKELLEGLHN